MDKLPLDPLTVFAVGGVASLLIERFFYYKSRYKKKNGNPGYGERIATLEEAVGGLKEDVERLERKVDGKT